MLDLPRILVPTDFSDRSATAAQYAKLLACRFHSELTLLHVIESSHRLRELMVPELQAAREETLQGFLVEELQGMPIRRILSSGEVASEIVACALDERTSLIVMPTHGYGPVRRFLLGSVTAKVLHDASCPVLTGWRLNEAFSPHRLHLRTVVCALDLGPASTRLLEWAGAFAASAGARLAVAHFICVPPPCGAYVNPEWAARVEQQAVSRIEMLLENAGLKAQIVVATEKTPDKGIANVIQHLNAGMLVVGRGGEYGTGGPLPSHAYALVRESPCPVISV